MPLLPQWADITRLVITTALTMDNWVRMLRIFFLSSVHNTFWSYESWSARKQLQSVPTWIFHVLWPKYMLFSATVLPSSSYGQPRTMPKACVVFFWVLYNTLSQQLKERNPTSALGFLSGNLPVFILTSYTYFLISTWIMKSQPSAQEEFAQEIAPHLSNTKWHKVAGTKLLRHLQTPHPRKQIRSLYVWKYLSKVTVPQNIEEVPKTRTGHPAGKLPF